MENFDSPNNTHIYLDEFNRQLTPKEVVPDDLPDYGSRNKEGIVFQHSKKIKKKAE